ncbi:MAG: NAD(P)/FAD-dependent oxidoreductase [Rudaea sp.]
MSRGEPITIIGAGLVGALLATLLAQRGFAVTLIERRPDPRVAGFVGGRSINLALAERGWHGLRLAGLAEILRPLAVMMRGRMVHHLDGHTELLRYGRDDTEVIWSIGRGDLNVALLNAGERAGVTLLFDQSLVSVDWNKSTVQLCDAAGVTHERLATCLIGADGAGSAMRAAMASQRDLGERYEPLEHGYKELAIPTRDGDFAMPVNALHIWPRGKYMCIALPNAEGSFTVTLFMPNGTSANPAEPSFANVASADAVHELFARDFADALPLIPDLRQDFMQNPTGVLGTLYLDHWHLEGRAVLLGDAAHPIVPFHGQGMNCGFEDAVDLAQLLEDARGDTAHAFAEFERRRKPNADAIAAMALENYIEMRDSVADAHFLLMRAMERKLAERHPKRFVPRYWMVTFTRLPYSTAFERGKIQAQILRELTVEKIDLDDIDWTHADHLIDARLPPLPVDY